MALKRLLRTAGKAVLFFVGWALCAGFGEIPTENPALWRFGAELFPLLWCVAFTVIFLGIDRRQTEIPLLRNAGRSILSGALVGAIWIGLCVGILVCLGAEKITGQNRVEALWLWVLSAFLNTVMQELLIRGYLYRMIKREYSTLSGALVTTGIFTLCHGGALEAGLLPVLNVVTMSLFMAALYEYYGSLLAPIMAHAVWNIVGSLVLGVSSLAEDYPSVMTMTATGNTLLSGGDYRLEGSIVVLGANVVLLLLFWFRKMAAEHRKSE